ncbi:MAG: AAA family ATPase [Candidatus Magasanikbacteria bacterium]|nr:AAA family ATPase [Candidatus Magasanikbacteria bacterium]
MEGVDGVGKTTLAKKLEEELGYYYLYTMLELFKSIRLRVELLKYPEVRFYFYITCVIAFQKELATLLNAGHKVFADRYIYSIIIMHKVMGVIVDCVDINLLPIITPNISILLTCDPRERNRRIWKREIKKQKYTHLDEFVLNRAQLYFMSLKNVFYVIDTTKKTEESVFNSVKSILNEQQQKVGVL